jgi:hypothetical protein
VSVFGNPNVSVEEQRPVVVRANKHSAGRIRCAAGFAFEAVAVRGAKRFAEGEDTLYVKAVAREAFHRTKGSPALLAPNPILLKGLPVAAGAVEAEASHVQFVHEEMVWNRERWSTLRNAVQWRRYGHAGGIFGMAGVGAVGDLAGQAVSLLPVPKAIAREALLVVAGAVVAAVLVGATYHFAIDAAGGG